jgi:hypothetical protein
VLTRHDGCLRCVVTLPRKWRIWGLGLWAGIVHGAASAGSAQVALWSAAGMGFDVKPLDFRSLGAVLVAGSVSSAFAYLRTSPRPRDEDETDFVVAVKPA